MKKYNSVEIEVVYLNNEDIITASGENYYESDMGNDNNNQEQGNAGWSKDQ